MLTWLTFSWVFDVVRRAYKHELTSNDVWEMDETNSCKNVSDDLELKWNAYISEFENLLIFIRHNKFSFSPFSLIYRFNRNEESKIVRVQTNGSIEMKQNVIKFN